MMIRHEQRESMQAARCELFAGRMVQRLARRGPARNKDLSNVELRVFVDSAIVYGRSIDIHAAANLQYLIEFLFDNGLDYESNARHDWARKILRNPHASETSRIVALNEHQVFAQRTRHARPHPRISVGASA